MIPFDFAKSVVSAASDFEETAQRIAHEMGLDAEDLKRGAADLAAVSDMGPVEALQRIADLVEGVEPQ